MSGEQLGKVRAGDDAPAIGREHLESGEDGGQIAPGLFQVPLKASDLRFCLAALGVKHIQGLRR
jgi:hypothetical protein